MATSLIPMSLSASPDPAAGLDLGSPVPLAAIPRSLKQLWESSAAVTRASAMNFAICSEDGSSLGPNTELIREVTREHACRAILIAITPAPGPPEIRAWITAHCQLAAGGRKSVCSEQITFAISGSGPQLLPNTLFAHVDSDLPLTLWWQGPFSPLWERHLFTEIDRLVIDSSGWHNPLAEFTTLEQSWHEANRGFSVNDLSWTRVLPFRMALAACFDEPGALALLPAISEITITHGSGHALAARMLAAWIAEKAGWSVTGGSSSSGFTLSNHGRTLTLTFKDCPGACAIARVHLPAPGGTILLTREPRSPFIEGRTDIAGQQTSSLTPCPCDSPADLVKERLRRGCNTRHYFALLEIVRQFLA